MKPRTGTGMPPLLVGAAALFWGWETGNPLAGVALALLLEAPRVVPFRLELTDADYRRLADFCTVLLAGVVALFFVNRGAARGVLSSLQWLPVLLAPIYLGQQLGPGLQASALFLYVRRQLRRDPAYPNPHIDVSGPYALLTAVAAGTPYVRSDLYFPGVVALSAWALLARRPPGAPLAAAIVLTGAAAALGYAGQAGLHRAQALLEQWVDEWLVILPNDPETTRTRIGSIGRIKQHDTVALRLYAKPAEREGLRLLHLASFTEYRGGAWIAREPAEASPPLAPAARTVPIVLRTQGGRALLPLPAGTVEVVGAGDGARPSRLGAVLAEAPKGWLRYEAGFADTNGFYAPPGPLDLAVPEQERQALERVAEAISLKGSSGPRAIEQLTGYFSQFRYTTWKESGPARGMTGLEDFLSASRSGHCEYFAAATTLLLRAAGIPARYATGYAVMEYSALEGAWLVRARHAHAWTRAYIGDRWVDVDLTPPSWAEEEASLAPSWERLLDLARWAAFRWSTRGEEEVPAFAWVIGALLAALLAALVLRRRARRRRAGAPSAVARRWAGEDSEFYELEKALAARYRPREPHEPLACWLSRLREKLEPSEQERLLLLLELHQRYRFDPRGIGAPEREALRAARKAAA